MSHMWSGRFDMAPDEDVFSFQASFGFDRRLFEDDVTGSLAWADALAEAQVLSVSEAVAIRKALTEILDRGRTNPAFVNGPDEDVHAFVERQLIARVGDAGKRLHTGRSRNEQVSLDLRLYLRRRIAMLQNQLVALVDTLANQAESAEAAVMPSYTHLRRAQPILVAHYFLAHVAAVRRDYRRFETAREEADLMPLGSGAIAGTSYDIDTSALAARLGFSRVVTNSLDATADRDFVSGFLHACASTMIHLSRLAEDLVIMTSEEFSYFGLSDAVTTGSSLMPQKKNPDPLELVRGKTGRVIGQLAGWLTTMKGLPSGYNKDLQEDKEAVFDAEDTLTRSIRATAIVVDSLALDPKRTESAAGGLALATDVVDLLVARGVPFREAHEVVGGMVRDLVARQRDFSSLTREEWRAYHQQLDADAAEQITAEGSVAARRTPQSTAPSAVAAALVEVRQWVNGLVGGDVLSLP
ncbi:MAG: argininosuccinate lyase [Acidobacteriota bacterium]|nr:argininosuccinate lyase [Acidobacteriota bacterium]